MTEVQRNGLQRASAADSWFGDFYQAMRMICCMRKYSGWTDCVLLWGHRVLAPALSDQNYASRSAFRTEAKICYAGNISGLSGDAAQPSDEWLGQTRRRQHTWVLELGDVVSTARCNLRYTHVHFTSQSNYLIRPHPSLRMHQLGRVLFIAIDIAGFSAISLWQCRDVQGQTTVFPRKTSCR